MDITKIKKIIKDNPRVILYFGADWEQFVNVNKATGGFIPNRLEGCTELCSLYVNGEYDGSWTFAGCEEDDEWLLVDLSHDRKARVV